MVAIAVVGWCGHKMNPILRGLLLAAALFLMFQGLASDLIGMAAGVVILLLHFTVFKKRGGQVSAA